MRAPPEVVCLIGFIQFALGAVSHKKMTVILIDVALITCLPFDSTASRKWKRGERIGIVYKKSRSLAKGNARSGGIRLQDAKTEIDLHPSMSPSARTGKPIDHRRGLWIERRMTDLLCPNGAGRKVRRGRGDMFQLSRLDFDDVAGEGRSR